MLAQMPDFELVAAVDPVAEKLAKFGERFGVNALYPSVDGMLADVVPDIVHLMTHPIVRAEPAVKCAEAGVKAVTMEKPLALRPSAAQAMAEASVRTGCHMAVNHQRRYMPHNQQLRAALQAGAIGEIQFVRASTFGCTLLEMPPHLIDLLLMMLGDVDPIDIWGTSAGAIGFQSPIFHFAPQRTLGRVFFPGIEVLVIHGPETHGVMGQEGCYMHLELNIWGTKGRAWTTDNGTWGYRTDGAAEAVGGPTGFLDQHEEAQQGFTRAVGAWIGDPAAGHECSFDKGLRGFGILMGLAKSSLTGLPLKYGDEVTDADMAALQQLLETREGCA
jgi:predicted dehydrogenase